MTSRIRIFAMTFVFLTLCGQPAAERLVLASASYGNNIVAICDADSKILWSQKTAGPKSGPKAAVIMFGTNDLGQLPAKEYEEKLRAVVERCLDNGTMPILTTIPPSGLRSHVTLMRY